MIFKLVERIKICYVIGGSYTPKDAIKAYNEKNNPLKICSMIRLFKAGAKDWSFHLLKANTYSFQAVMDRRKIY